MEIAAAEGGAVEGENLMSNPKQFPCVDSKVKGILDAVERSRLLHEGISRWSEQLTSFRRSIEAATIPFRMMTEPITDFQRVIMRATEPIRRLVVEEQEFKEQIRRACEEIDKDNAWLLTMGWPPLIHAPSDASRRLRITIGNLVGKKGRREVDRAIVRFYDESRIRKEIVAGWEQKTFLKRRLTILRCAVDAHVRGDYALSVPALLAQIEGIVADYFGCRGHVAWKKVKSNVTQLMLDGGLLEYNDLYRQFVMDVVLANFEHGDPIPDLNRHAILHGADIDYARAEKSLKAILVLDFLLTHIHLISVGSAKTYHRPECACLRKRDSRRKVYQSAVMARAFGLTPCQRCRPEVSEA